MNNMSQNNNLDQRSNVSGGTSRRDFLKLMGAALGTGVIKSIPGSRFIPSTYSYAGTPGQNLDTVNSPDTRLLFLAAIRQFLTSPEQLRPLVDLECDPAQYPDQFQSLTVDQRTAQITALNHSNNCGPAAFANIVNMFRQLYPTNGTFTGENMNIENAIGLLSGSYYDSQTKSERSFIQKWNGTMYPYDLYNAFNAFGDIANMEAVEIAGFDYGPLHDPTMIYKPKVKAIYDQIQGIFNHGGVLVLDLIKYGWGHLPVATNLYMGHDGRIKIFVIDAFGYKKPGDNFRSGIIGEVDLANYVDQGWGGTGMMYIIGVRPKADAYAIALEAFNEQQNNGDVVYVSNKHGLVEP